MFAVNNSNHVIDIAPIQFDTIDDLLNFYEKIKDFKDDLHKQLILATNGETYVLQDILNGKITDTAKDLCFIVRLDNGLLQKYSIDAIRICFANNYPITFIYNYNLAAAFQNNASIKKPRNKTHNAIRLDETSFNCFLFKRLMFFPMITRNGISYESVAISKWVDTYQREPDTFGPFTWQVDPVTNKPLLDGNNNKLYLPLSMSDIVPNKALQSLYNLYFNYNIQRKLAILKIAENRISTLIQNPTDDADADKKTIKTYQDTIVKIGEEFQTIADDMHQFIDLLSTDIDNIDECLIEFKDLPQQIKEKEEALYQVMDAADAAVRKVVLKLLSLIPLSVLIAYAFYNTDGKVSGSIFAFTIWYLYNIIKNTQFVENSYRAIGDQTSVLNSARHKWSLFTVEKIQTKNTEKLKLCEQTDIVRANSSRFIAQLPTTITQTHSIMYPVNNKDKDDNIFKTTSINEVAVDINALMAKKKK